MQPRLEIPKAAYYRMHADEDGNQVKHDPEYHENHGHHLHVEEGEDQVNPERNDDHFQGGEGEGQIQLPQKSILSTCTQKKMNIKSNTVKNTMVISCMQKKVEIK